MFCVIQETELRKANKHGYHKKLKVYTTSCTSNGVCKEWYRWSYEGERFERLVKKAYRISIQESYRLNGTVKKKQFPICTVNYYELATDMFTLYDWGDNRIQAVAKELKVSEESIYEMIQEKLKPFIDRIQAEFQQTQEFIVSTENDRITTVYALKKIEFSEKYGVDQSEYDCCYDVFGTLRNKKYLEKVKAECKARKEYERASRKNSRGYYENYYSNYNSSGGSSSTISNKKSEDKDSLKLFYRVLSKKFHPDVNPDTDTSKQMKLLNQLKEEWGV